MAIEKTMFTSTTISGASAEVFEWLKKNAAEYFDSFTKGKDDSGEDTDEIICMKNGKKIISIFGYGTASKNQHFVVYNKEQTPVIHSWAIYSFNYNPATFSMAYKTDHGIVLFPFSVTSGVYRKCALFVSKTEEGELVCASQYFTGYNSGDYANIAIIAPESETSVVANRGYQTRLTDIYKKSEMTAFCEVISRTGKKCPGLYYLPFVQYPDTTAVINDGSKQYISDGFFALEE